MKNKSAFTLIELLVVMGIVALMTLLAVPFFSRYGSRSEFDLRTTEVKALIEQMNNMAKNPKQRVTRYVIKADSGAKTIELRENDSAGELIKKITLPSDYTLAIQGVESDKFLVCDTPAAFCCKMPEVSSPTPTIGECETGSKFNDDYISITGLSGDESLATFKINSEPFRVTVY